MELSCETGSPSVCLSVFSFYNTQQGLVFIAGMPCCFTSRGNCIEIMSQAPGMAKAVTQDETFEQYQDVGDSIQFAQLQNCMQV